jgi:hypothetical protein
MNEHVTPPDTPEANARARADGQTITFEVTEQQQYPTREKIAEALRFVYDESAEVEDHAHRVPYDIDYTAADAVLALFPQPTPSAEADGVRQLRAELDEAEQRENEMSEHLHPSWDGDDAQIAILMRFVEHAAKLDSVIEEAREADGWEGRDLTFVWHDDEQRLEWVPQPTPSAEPTWDERIKASRPLDLRNHEFEAWEEVEAARLAAEPLSIADVAPGATLLARSIAGGPLLRFWVTTSELVNDQGKHRPWSSVDPSTIRDVTPPPNPGS